MEINSEFVHTGDSASLYNYTLSPGWTREEVEILRFALMKYGVGKWTEICESGCLPGKTPSQCSMQTQRLLGQQSIAEFMGLHLDPDVIRKENNSKIGVLRKNGCIINSGNKLRPDEVKALKKKNKEVYGIPVEVYSNISLPLYRTESKDGEVDGVTSAGDDHSSCTPFTSDDDSEREEKNLQELLAAKCNGCSKDQLDVSERELTRKIEQQTEELSVLRSKRRELLQAIGDMEEKLKQFKNNSKEEAAVARLSQKGNSKCTVKETIQLSYLPEHNSLQVGERALKKKTKERFCKESKGKGIFNDDNAYDADDVSKYPCVCHEAIKPNDYWLACDVCDTWYHGSCVGIQEQEAASLEWLCSNCHF